MTFDHDFCYSFPLFSSLLKKKKRKGEKNRDQKSCLSARSYMNTHIFFVHLSGSFMKEISIFFHYAIILEKSNCLIKHNILLRFDQRTTLFDS